MIYDKCIPFDHRSYSISDLVQSSMTNEAYERWKKCCEDAINCCTSMIENFHGENFFNNCDAHWNGFSCFDETDSGKMIKMECPYHKTRNDHNRCECE